MINLKRAWTLRKNDLIKCNFADLLGANNQKIIRLIISECRKIILALHLIVLVYVYTQQHDYIARNDQIISLTHPTVGASTDAHSE